MATAKRLGLGGPRQARLPPLVRRPDRLPLGETFNTVTLAVLVARTLMSSQWPSVPGLGGC
jgi:hypothetical protein